MKKYQWLIVGLLLVAMVFSQINCATIFDGSKSPTERTSDLQWGYVLLDLIVTSGIGLIIDFADGAIYEKKHYPSKSNLEQDLKDHLKKVCLVIP